MPAVGAESAKIETTTMSNQEMVEYPVQCHCGAVSGRFKYAKGPVTAWDCNCSDCYMRRNVHIIIPEKNFFLTMKNSRSLEEATILYQWGTKTAVRRFCKTCGMFVSFFFILLF